MCPRCFGLRKVPGTALMRVVGGDEPTVTRGYIHELYHLARAWRDGWRMCIEESNNVYMRKEPTYAEIRDFLRGEFDVDYVSACQVALVLTRPARVGWPDPPLYGFHPVV